jgi:hypothetical protein
MARSIPTSWNKAVDAIRRHQRSTTGDRSSDARECREISDNEAH